jgi:hypothetical protein
MMNHGTTGAAGGADCVCVPGRVPQSHLMTQRPGPTREKRLILLANGEGRKLQN